MTVKMRREVRDAWADALESGKYQQVKGVLVEVDGDDESPVGFCCLGVLCDLAVQDGVKVPVAVSTSDEGDRLVRWYQDSYTGLPRSVAEWAGLVNVTTHGFTSYPTDPALGGTRNGVGEQRTAATWNDDYDADFREIAAMVRNIEAVEA